MAKVLHHSVEIDGLADPVLLILDLLNPKSIGFDRLSRTTTVPIFLDQGFSFYHSNIHRHIVTK